MFTVSLKEEGVTKMRRTRRLGNVYPDMPPSLRLENSVKCDYPGCTFVATARVDEVPIETPLTDK
jgi:hypothetical protein